MRRTEKVLTRILFLSFLFLSFFAQFGRGEDFYLNLLQKSRQEYLKENYQKVIDHLKIAEFGLREDKALLKEIYFYYMASYFKLYQPDQVKESFNSFKRLFNESGLDAKDFPADIYEDLIMVDILTRKDFKKSLNLKSQISYERIFYKTIMDIEKVDSAKLLKIYQQLKQIDKKDARRTALTAIIDYRNKKYQKAVNQLQKTVLSPALTLIEVKDKLYYFLVLACYNLKEFKKIPAIINKINSQSLISHLQGIININKVDKK